MKTKPEPVFLTRADASALASVSTVTLDKWLARPDAPPHTRIGRRVLIEREPFIAWIKGHPRASSVPAGGDV